MPEIAESILSIKLGRRFSPISADNYFIYISNLYNLPAVWQAGLRSSLAQTPGPDLACTN